MRAYLGDCKCSTAMPLGGIVGTPQQMTMKLLSSREGSGRQIVDAPPERSLIKLQEDCATRKQLISSVASGYDTLGIAASLQPETSSSASLRFASDVSETQ